MKILDFFRRNKSNDNQVIEPTATDADLPIVNKDLFSDIHAPTITAVSTSNQGPSQIRSFLNRDYNNIGYTDGYEHHNSETLAQKLLMLKSEFRQIADEAIDERQQEIFQLRKQHVQTRNLSPRLSEQIELQIAEVETKVAKLEQEKALSTEDEGLVMRVIHAYRDGFLRGSQDWHEVSIFARRTGLF
jgi:uncharacterized membrane protein